MLFSVSVFANNSAEYSNEYSDNTYDLKKKTLKETTVYIAGDSTLCEYGYDENYAIPRAGWGMYLSKFLNDKAKVVNLALSGRSSKSFTTEENYKKLFENIKEGDFLLIQFGHNDEKNKTEGDLKTIYTDPSGDKDTNGSFKHSLYTNYILPAKEKGAVPILISPVSRIEFDEYGKIADSHGLYDDAVRELAEETGVYFVDMTNITADKYNQLSLRYGAYPLHAVYKDPEKGTDNTHFSHLGAAYIAFLFATETIKKDIPISEYLLSEKEFDKKIEKNLEIISRGEFIAMLMRAAGIEGKANDNFSDVDKNSGYANAVGLAKEAGIALGDETGKFNPEDTINLYEMASFIMRTLRYLNFEYEHVDIHHEFEYIANWQDNYTSFPKYAVQDMADWFYLEDTDLKWFYLDDKIPERYFVQAEIIRLYELLNKKQDNEQQSIDNFQAKLRELIIKQLYEETPQKEQ